MECITFLVVISIVSILVALGNVTRRIEQIKAELRMEDQDGNG